MKVELIDISRVVPYVRIPWQQPIVAGSETVIIVDSQHFRNEAARDGPPGRGSPWPAKVRRARPGARKS